MTGLGNVVAIAAGGFHSLAIRSPDTLWAWGADLARQLGTGTSGNRSTPAATLAPAGVVVTEGGRDHSLALHADGDVWAWGGNEYGQVGTGVAFAVRAIPERVPVVSEVLAIAAGWYFNLALDADGRVWAWGRNDDGQLGVVGAANRTAPVHVPGLVGIGWPSPPRLDAERRAPCPTLPERVPSPMPRESQAARRARAALVLEGLRACYPDARTELDFGTPFQLVIATLLSAQATDVSVNAATPALFARCPTPEAMAAMTPEEVEPFVRTIGLYRNKAKNAVAAARRIVEAYGGEVPRTVEELVTLPGVGRKTANVVVANAFGVPAIAVDTHVGRLARRLGFSKHADPDKVEADLQKLYPSEQWVFLHHALILHGRRVCAARKPACAACAVAGLCPSRVG